MDKLSDEQLDLIVESTLSHYDVTAEDFWEASKNHNIEQNYQAFLNVMPKTKPLKILDLGCGPGRDLRYFKDLGHEPVGLEGSETFCHMARKYAECEVWQQNFLAMELPNKQFDGVFANASLFHIPQQELPRILRELFSTLKDGGALFTSNPRKPHVVWYGKHPGTYMEYEPFAKNLKDCGFEVIDHYYRPTDKPFEEQFWIATVSKKKTIFH
ncbi:MAG: methyltransferase domain-containing protein [Deltaproteobacteria bacterium]|nr:methyltransferase domain-containing protein [Deltaproteobacteria bacterium]